MSARYDEIRRTMCAALDMVKDAYGPVGDDFAFTLVVRHKTDPNAHCMVGQDDLEGLSQFLCELAASPGKMTGAGNREKLGEMRPVGEGRA